MIADASQIARDVVEWTESWLGGFSVGDWVALAVAAAAIYWIVVSMRTNVRLGTIEIESLEQEEMGGASVKELTATLRERLAHAGPFPAPEVPAGAPNVSLAAAVEASGVPQAAWIARLMELLPTPPRPPSYKLGGTVRGADSEHDPPCRVSFRLRSVNGSCELLETASGASDEDAVQEVAIQVYLHVIKHCLQAIPTWARWDSRSAFHEFLGGLAIEAVDERLERFQRLARAARAESSNLVVRLKIANLMEQRADGFDPKTELGERVALQARALNRYLRIAQLEPALVEARYRSAVLAAMLASSVESDRLLPPRLSGQLPILDVDDDEPDELVQALRDLARLETRAVLHLLRPWYTLLRARRLRNELEPRSLERRELKRTVGISKHCQRLHRVRIDDRWRSSVLVGWSQVVVRAGHLTLGGLSMGWQAHYNASCFYTLVRARAQQIREGRDASAKNNGVPTRREVALDKRALQHLNRALRESHNALSGDWIGRDPDLNQLGDRLPAQRTVIAERHGADGLRPPHPSDRRPEQDATDKSDLWEWNILAFEHSEGPTPVEYPERPWGDPLVRLPRWGTLLLGLWAGAAAVLALTRADATHVVVIVAALTALLALRIGLLVLQARRMNAKTAGQVARAGPAQPAGAGG